MEAESERFMQEIVDLREAVAMLRTDVKMAFKRIDEQHAMVETVHNLALSLRDMAGEIKAMRKDVDSLRRDMDAMQARPAEHWQTLVKSALSGVAGALVGAGMLLILNR